MRKAIIICVLAAALTACGSVDESSGSKASRIGSKAKGIEVNSPAASVVIDDGSENLYERNVQTYYSAYGEKFDVELSRYSNDAQVVINYVTHGYSDYIPEMNGSHKFIIRTEDEFKYVKSNYGLSFIDTEFYTGGCEGEFIECGFDEYDYVIEYDEHSTGGYFLRPGGLVVDTDKLEFVFTNDSKLPGDTDMVTEAFTGDLFIAAIPKGTLMNEHYEGWEYIDLADIDDPLVDEPVEEPAQEQPVILDDTDEYMREGTLVATIQDGSGEVMRMTEVYRLDDDWCYVNFDCKTTSWGSPEWERNIIVSGRVHTLDAVIKAARDFGSDGFVTYPSDKDTHTIEEFIEKWS